MHGSSILAFWRRKKNTKSYKTAVISRRVFDEGAFLSGDRNYWITDGVADTETLAAEVAWVSRAIRIRAGAFASMPWDLMRGNDEDPICNEKDWQDWPNWLTGYMEGWKTALTRFESARMLYGAGYFYLMQGQRTEEPKGFRYILPSSITPDIDQIEGLRGFKREVGGQKIDWPLERVLWSWVPATHCEIGPGTAPADTCSRAAEILRYMERAGVSVYSRGPIMNTIVIFPAHMDDEDVQRMMADIRSGTTGVDNTGGLYAWKDPSGEMEIKTEQFGIEPNRLVMPQVEAAKVETIAAAFDIPLSVMNSKASRNWTDQADDVRLYEHAIIPAWEQFRQSLNDALDRFPAPHDGYHIKIRPERLEAYQIREAQKAQAYVQMVGKPFILRNEAREAMGLESLDVWDKDRDDIDDTDQMQRQNNSGGDNGNNQPDTEKRSPLLNMAAGITSWLAVAQAVGMGQIDSNSAANGLREFLGLPDEKLRAMLPEGSMLSAQLQQEPTEQPEVPEYDEIMEAGKLWASKSKRMKSLAHFATGSIPAWLKTWTLRMDTQYGPEIALEWAKNAELRGYLDQQKKRLAKLLAELLGSYNPNIVSAIMERDNYELLLERLGADYEDLIMANHIRVTQYRVTQLNLASNLPTLEPSNVAEAAIRWARSHAYERSKYFNDTTHKLVNEAVQTFYSKPGMTRQDLEDLLAPAVDPKRGRPDVAAVTEVTDASNGAVREYQNIIEKDLGIRMLRQWHAYGDSCAVCLALDGQYEDPNTGSWGEFEQPPAHPNCECDTTLELPPDAVGEYHGVPIRPDMGQH